MSGSNANRGAVQACFSVGQLHTVDLGLDIAYYTAISAEMAFTFL